MLALRCQPRPPAACSPCGVLLQAEASGHAHHVPRVLGASIAQGDLAGEGRSLSGWTPPPRPPGPPAAPGASRGLLAFWVPRPHACSGARLEQCWRVTRPEAWPAEDTTAG